MTLVRPVTFPPFARSAADSWFWGAAVLLSIAAALVFGHAPRPPIGIQIEEVKKATYILEGRQDFNHPLLMLNIGRLLNLVAGITDVNAMVEFGRGMAAAFGGLTVFATIALARRAMGPAAALGAGLLAAAAPLTVIHSQVLKEDIFLTPWLLFGCLALVRLREDLNVRNAILFGVALGLAASTKYVGVVLLLVALSVPFFGAVDRQLLGSFYRQLGISLLVALAVFLLANIQLFWSYAIFADGLGKEVDHAFSGHVFYLPAWLTWFIFHWSENVWPGLRAPLALAGLGGALLIVARWTHSPVAIRVVLALGVVWYLAHEGVPMKPMIGSERYVTPLGSVFAILAAYFVYELARRLADLRLRAAALGVGIAILAVPAAYASFQISRSAPYDTRIAVETVKAALEGPVVMDAQADFEAKATAFLQRGRDWRSVRYLILSEKIMGRMLAYENVGTQPERSRRWASAYRVSSELPFIRITSTAGSFSNRNLVLRVIALNDNVEHLERIATRIPALPMIELEVVREQQAAEQRPDRKR